MPRWSAVTIPDSPPPKGPYSPAVRAGDFIYVSGQTPRDPITGELVGSDVAAQARQTLDNVRRVLAAAGATMSDVISVTIYLEEADDWATMNGVYAEYFAAPFPTRTTIGASLRDILIEINAIAYIGRS